MSDIREKFEDRGSERIVLASILQFPDLLFEADAKLEERDFLSPHHKNLYIIIRSLDRQGIKRFDFMSLMDEASRLGFEDKFGGPEYLNALLSTLVDKKNFEVYLERLVDASTKYKLYNEVENIKNEIVENSSPVNSSSDAFSLLASAENRIIDVSMGAQRVEEAIDIGEGLQDRLEEVARNPVNIVGLSTGIPLLDYALNGLAPGTLTVVAARPKSGKSTLLMNIASHLVYKLGVPILYVDTEMMRAEIQTRLVSQLSQVPERKIITGRFIENELETSNVWRACEIVSKGKYLHKYYPGFAVDALKSLVRKYKIKEGIGAFFFDYIKTAGEGSLTNTKEYQHLGFLASALKDLAGQLEIPVITAAQIRRSQSGSPKTRANDEDVGGSDRILHLCNHLLALSRKSVKEIEEDGRTCGTHRLQVLASRGGRQMFEGIDLDCDLSRLTMVQAEHQAAGRATFDFDQEASF